MQRANPELFDFNNGFDCAVKVYKSEGITAFWDGVTARSAWLVPRYCVAISLFELLKQQI